MRAKLEAGMESSGPPAERINRATAMNHLQVARLWVSGLLQAFERVGLDVNRLGVNLDDIGTLNASGEHPAIEVVRSLWHRASVQNDSPVLGIEVAWRHSPRSSGVLLPIMLHSPTALQALHHLVAYQPLLSDSGQYRITAGEAEQVYRCEYRPTSSSVAVSNHQVLAIVTQTLGTLRTITNRHLDVPLLEVPEGMDATRIGKALKCPCRTHAGNFRLHLGAASLEAAVSERDDHLYQINLSYAEGLIRAKRQRQTFISGIKARIDTERPAQVDIDQVARTLGLHKRLLQRNLHEHHTSFRQLKTSVLKSRALDRLIVKGWHTETIAEDLGYSDLSTFHRAFKSWFGVSPKQFRERPHV